MPSRRRISSTTFDALPTSVWMRMYALTAMRPPRSGSAAEWFGGGVVWRHGNGRRSDPLRPLAQARAYTHQPSRPASWTGQEVDEDGAPMSSTNPPTRHQPLLD